MKKILIYKGEGADPFCVTALLSALQQEKLDQFYSLCWADKQLFQRNEWQKETHLVIFPGGRDTPFQQALRGSCNRHIMDFVHKGGNFLGICAGGYYGSATIEFEQGGPLEIIAHRELKFFPGVARGPAYGLGKFNYQSDKGAQIAQLNLFLFSSSTSSTAAAYYNGGCVFVKAEQYKSISVMARYADIEDQPAAIVRCAVGGGQAILCGVHPEYSAYHPCTENRFKGAQFSPLKEIEGKRRMLFINILRQLGCQPLKDV